MAQEIFLPSLGINCQGERVPDFENDQLLKGVGLPIDENSLVLLPADRFTMQGVEKSLNYGAFSWIVSGYDNKLNQKVAIKVMKRCHESERGIIINDFAKEARLMMMLNHPNILTVHGLTLINFLSEIVPAIIMDLADGSLDEEGSLDPTTIGEAVLSIAGALDYLRENQVVHLDICPGNILRKRKQFLIGDFGAAIDWRGSNRIISHCDYDAPELMSWSLRCESGHIVYSRQISQVDQHALAVTAFELLTQDKSGCLWMTLDGKIEEGHANPETVLNNQLRLNFEAYRVLARATSYKPEDRYESCVDFALALKEGIEV